MSARASTRDPGDGDARADLVRAAADLFGEDLLGVIAQGLRPDDVAARASRSRRSFYAHFADRRELVVAIAASLLADPSGAPATPTLNRQTAADLAAAVDHVEGDLLHAVGTLTDRTFRHSLTSERAVQIRRMWALAPDDPSIVELYRSYVRSSDGAVALVIDAVNDRLGLRLRAPWNAEQVAVVVRALADGLAMRHSVDPEVAQPELYSLVGLSLLSVLTQPAAEPPVALLDHLEGFVHEVLQGWRDQNARTDLTDGRERIMVALREAVAEHGPNVDLEEVALRSGLSRQTIVAAFGSLEGVVDAAVHESVPDLVGEAEFDLATSHLEAREVIRRHLLRIAGWATDEPELAVLVVAAGADGSRSIGSPAARRFLGAAAIPLARILHHFDPDRADDPQLSWTAITCTGALLSRVTTGSQPTAPTVEWLTNLAVAMLDTPPLGSPDDRGDAG